MSKHEVLVVRIGKILPHPNADKLEIVPIPGSSWQCVAQKGIYQPGQLVVYVEPDYIVPTNREEFAWLKKEGDKDEHRVKAMRLRGTLSFGLMIPVSPVGVYEMDTNVWREHRPGDNVMHALGIKRYVIPEDKGVSNNQAAGADNLKDEWPVAPIWHLENIQKYPAALIPGEPVVVTEKLDGTSARYLHKDGVFYVGTRTRWLSPDFRDNYWQVAATPEIRAWCAEHEGTILFGEIIGAIKSAELKYGFERGVEFRAFQAYAPGDRWNAIDGLVKAGVKTVPLVYMGPWMPALILPEAEKDTRIDRAPHGHMTEGLVIMPEEDRRDPELGKVVVKFISERYWVTKPAK
jgi:RNA ligase (TIGR02306 family)